MNNDLEFQMVCYDCGSLAIKIENPVSASRETIVHCGECGASRWTIGALKDLAVRAHVPPTRQRPQTDNSCSELVSLHKELQSLRRKVKMAEFVARTEQLPRRCQSLTRPSTMERQSSTKICMSMETKK